MKDNSWTPAKSNPCYIYRCWKRFWDVYEMTRTLCAWHSNALINYVIAICSFQTVLQDCLKNYCSNNRIYWILIGSRKLLPKAEKIKEYGHKLCQKCGFYFRKFWRKRQKYPSKLYISLKIAQISLQKHIFPRNEMTKFHIFSMHASTLSAAYLWYIIWYHRWLCIKYRWGGIIIASTSSISWLLQFKLCQGTAKDLILLSLWTV